MHFATVKILFLGKINILLHFAQKFKTFVPRDIILITKTVIIFLSSFNT